MMYTYVKVYIYICYRVIHDNINLDTRILQLKP